MERYTRNHSTISQQQQIMLKDKKIAIVGCGGLGGNIAMALARIGVGHLLLIDSDIFDITNLNRQIFSDEADIGLPKSPITKTKLETINSTIKIDALQIKVDNSNVKELIKDFDLVFDGLDNIETRLLLEDACIELAIPLIQGAIEGNYGHFGVSYNNSLIHHIYRNSKISTNNLGNLSYVASFIAACQVKLGLDFILKNEFKNGFYSVDLNDFDIEFIAL